MTAPLTPTGTARGLSLRRFLLLLAGAGATYVAAIALLITIRIAPTAASLEQHSTRVLAADDAIRTRVRVLRQSIEGVRVLIDTSRDAAGRPSDVATRRLVISIRARLDSVTALRYAASLEGIPVAMRMDLASATQSESELGTALLDALAELQLGHYDAAMTRLASADEYRQRTEDVLQSAQRSALADMVEREHHLGRAAAFAGKAVLGWLAIGGGLVPVLLFFFRTRVHVPLRELEQALERLARGDLDVAIVARRDDEIGRLGRHFNAMIAVLRLRAGDEKRRNENLAERLGHLLEESTNEIFVLDGGTFRVLQASRGAREHLGYAMEDLQRLSPQDLLPPADTATLHRLLDDLRTRKQSQLNLETRLLSKNGGSYPVTLNVQMSFSEQPPVFVAVAQDISERREAERLREALRDFSLSSGPLLATGDTDRFLKEITAVTAQALQVERVGVWRLDKGTLRCADLYERHNARHTQGEELAPETHPHYFSALRTDRVIAVNNTRGDLRTEELDRACFDPAVIHATLDVPVQLSGQLAGALRVMHVGHPRNWTPEEQSFAASMADFVAIALEGAERRSLHAQLVESQRLESVGQLAGGVAHDFNNLLTAMLSHAELAALSLGDGHPALEDLNGIQQVVQRAADLTRQLLTFARRQVVEPKVVDLNRLTQRMDTLLRRLIGEDIELVTLLAPALGSARVDPTHFEQVIVNLAVNARDAMPRGGKLTLTTSNIALSAEDARQHPEITPGRYVMLAVTDTGVGMDDAVRARVFEPFYTTKDRSKGTGLGLATAYGIVRQAGGHISVTSALGKGTTFRMYLPVVDEAAEAASDAGRLDSPRGSETVLLVEDEPQLRDLLVRGLKAQGYHLLVARNGTEALETARRHPGPIHLLVTDVVMPLLNGPDLAEALSTQRPAMGILFVSGYAEETVVHQGVVDPGIAFLPKPFTLAVLAQRVREALDTAHLAQAPGWDAPITGSGTLLAV